MNQFGQSLPLSSLSLWPRNYHKGHVSSIARSISRFGFNASLRYRTEGGKLVVYAGNHSFLALSQLKASGSPPPMHVVEDGGEWLVPVISINHLSEAEAMAFAIADNRTNELAFNDEEALRELQVDLVAVDPSLLIDAGYDAELAERLQRQVGEFEAERSLADFSPDHDARQGRFGEPRANACPHCGGELPVG